MDNNNGSNKMMWLRREPTKKVQFAVYIGSLPVVVVLGQAIAGTLVMFGEKVGNALVLGYTITVIVITIVFATFILSTLDKWPLKTESEEEEEQDR